jgi:hypothetical protein
MPANPGTVVFSGIKKDLLLFILGKKSGPELQVNPWFT